MKALLLTNEYPPHVYGGAGVHVEFLSRELAKLMDVEVRSFGEQREKQGALTVRGFQSPLGEQAAPKPLRPVFDAFGRNLAMAAAGVDADVVHCHTWYSHLGGLVIKLTYGVPLVITVHSLEPLRPWKREQLQGGYEASRWVEKTALEAADAVIAVSKETRADVERLFNVDPARIRVIHNGIDADLYAPSPSTSVLERLGVDPSRPYVLFVGRVTRQKGIVHLVRALPLVDRTAQVVLCAGAPDTPEIAAEMEAAIAAVQSERQDVLWVRDVLGRDEAIQLYTHAAVFCCPSIYEPFGIINLEAMACGTPVVASAVGGIPEVVEHGVNGLLVQLEQQSESPYEPLDPAGYSRDLAEAINTLLADPARRERMAQAGRKVVEERFTWQAIASETKRLYESL